MSIARLTLWRLSGWLAACLVLGLLVGAARADAAPLIVAPVTANVGEPIRLGFEDFPPGIPVRVDLFPNDAGCCEAIAARHVPIDGAGRGGITFQWPATWTHCVETKRGGRCREERWKPPEQADISAETERLPPGGGRTVNGALTSVRLQPPGAPPPDLLLAQRFRPVLVFDSSERWRPLQVDRLFASDIPRECPGAPDGGCTRAVSSTELSNRFVPPVFLDWPGHQDDAGSYRSARPECLQNGLADCDTGPQSAIYAHEVEHEGYRYLDYWWFLRFNDAPFTRLYYDQHEGDWEGATVAVRAGDPDPQTFDFVGIAAHKGVWRYLRNVLICEDPATHEEAGCGASAAQRLKVFVANGTHAGYPRPCRQIIFLSCRQTGIPFPEKGFDGRRPWGNNDDFDALQAFRIAWVDWPGNWNSAPQPRVNSPARQGRFQHPWETKCTTRFSGNRFGCVAASAAQVNGSADCESWLGPFAAAAACDPGQLAQALRAGTLGEGGSLTIALDGSLTSSAPGVAQAVGEALQPGQSLTLSGTGSPAAQLLVNAEDERGVLAARYTHLGLRSGGAVTVQAGQAGGRVTLRATTAAGTTIRPTDTLRESRHGPAGPRRVRAHRRGRRIRVTFVARSGRVSVDLHRRRSGRALSSRVVRLRHTGRHTITVAGSRHARFVTVAALSRSGIPSRAVTTKIR